MPSDMVPGEPFNRQLEVIRLLALTRIHDGEIITGTGYSPVLGTRMAVFLAIFYVLGDLGTGFGPVIPGVRLIVEERHATMVTGNALTGWAQPQTTTEMTGIILICNCIGHITD